MDKAQGNHLPKVSIVFTTFNAESFIKPSVKAALNQDYPNFEVLVLNDGSTDNTEKACMSIQDTRFRYIARNRLGRCRALNEAISLASGDFIAINDADDLSLPYRLSYAIGFFRKNKGVAFVATRFFKTNVFNGAIPDDFSLEILERSSQNIVWPGRITVFRRNLFNNSTLVYPKAVWKAVGGYDENLTINEDYDFYLRAMQFGKVALLPLPTVLWYTNPHGYYKQKDAEEYLTALAFIKRRAHGLLDLPLWIKPYHSVWTQVYRAGQLWRRLHSDRLRQSGPG